MRFAVSPETKQLLNYYAQYTFAAEYLTEAVLTLTQVQLPDRAVGFMLGVLGMRALDVVIGVFQQVAKDPKAVLEIILNFVTKKFKIK